MFNFYKFFEELYKKPTITKDNLIKLVTCTSKPYDKSALNSILDSDITYSELEEAIHDLKKGKAVSEDLVANEFLLFSSISLRETILHLFNECLKTEIYPWNTSLITPLHKKGSIYDPDNYRAIAIASNLGKLFSSILLKRLIEFRHKNCPDTPNQFRVLQECSNQ